MPQLSAFLLLMLGLLVTGSAAAQQSSDKDTGLTPAKERKLTRRERKELARRVALETAQQTSREPSAREREQSEAYFVDGVRYALLEDYPKAMERLLKAYALSPTNAAISYKIAEVNMLSGNLKDATNFAQAAVRLDPKNTYYYLLLAQTYTTQKQYDQAAKVYTSLIRDVPDSNYYLFNLADLYLAQGKLQEALTTYEQAEQEFGPTDEVAFKKQQIYLKQNKLDKALQEGETLIASNPDDVRYVLAQAQMYVTNNRLPDALRVTQQALRQAPDNPQARMILADVYRLQGKKAESEEQLKLAFGNSALDIDTKVRILIDYIRQLPNPALTQTVLDLAALTTRAHPQEAKAFAMAGDVQTIVERRQEARASYLRALQLDNSKFQIWQQVVLLDAELNQTDSLLAHTERALELFPNQAPLWFYNGVGHVLKKEPKQAIKSLEYGRKLTTDNPELQAQFNTQLGDVYHELKDYSKSDAAYEAALGVDANNAQALNNYSYYLSLRGEKLDKAKQMAGRLVKQFPDNPTYLDTYAWVLYKLKDYTGARQALETALKHSSDGTLLEHYGDVLFQLQQPTQAVAAWERAKKAGDASALIDRKIKEKKLYE
ncbi:tetratricopeptide repeat protein [Hymenobacter aerilatus]|uniref:Tetratricopeptide repeat protein n=1 Tax=Hymenobacter aerilatus TaxID=2932251 RepID=A0A8T9SZN8_9BACT|nr:tetratricopeptide repeat protein [Hymenobacter aerilatus]UOR05229.1 tetratricopeptide repeat protein [Hymenobacter aerilatus]